jgi:hypothetical protein
MARVVMTLIATMASAAPASADTLSVSSRPAHPSGVTPVTFTAKWSTKSTTATVSVGVEPTNVKSCPTTPDPKGGVRVIDAFPAIGTKSTTSPATTFKHGTYLVCGWLVDVTGVLATDHRRLKVSNPDRLSMTAPATATDGATSSVTFTGVADVPDPIVYVKRIPGARARCGRDPRAGSGQPLTGAAPVPGRNGSFRSVASIALGVSDAEGSDRHARIQRARARQGRSPFPSRREIRHLCAERAAVRRLQTAARLWSGLRGRAR